MKGSIKRKIFRLALLAASLSFACIGAGSLKTEKAAAATEPFSIQEGASVKLMNDKNDSGIRFRYYINADTYAAIQAGTSTFVAMLAPKGALNGAELTVDNEVAAKTTLTADKWYEQTDGSYTSYIYLFNLPEAVYDDQISARGALVTDGTPAYTATQSRSIGYVAKSSVLKDGLGAAANALLGNYYTDYAMSLDSLYPDWYDLEDSQAVVKAVNVENAEEVLLLPVSGALGNRSVDLIGGTYNLTYESAHFETVTQENVAVTEDGALTAAFKRYKVGNATGLTKGDGSVKLAGGNEQFHPLENVVAKEGFVISYDMSTEQDGEKELWINGGFAFKMNNRWYSLLVYTRENAVASYDYQATALRIGLTDQEAVDGGNTARWTDSKDDGSVVGSEPCFLSTPVTVTAEDLKNSNITIAYYQGSYYVRFIGGAGAQAAFRVTPELFDDTLTRAELGFTSGQQLAATAVYAKGKMPAIFFDEDVKRNCNDNQNLAKRTAYGTVGYSSFFAVGERTLGFRALDGINVFTNIQYHLGDAAAITAIKSMAAARAAVEAKASPSLQYMESCTWPTALCGK